jgi:hypothetical protein
MTTDIYELYENKPLRTQFHFARGRMTIFYTRQPFSPRVLKICLKTIDREGDGEAKTLTKLEKREDSHGSREYPL